VALCEKLYLREHTPHPLLGFHYYKLGKTLSMVNDYARSCEYLHNAFSILNCFYSICDDRGEMVNGKLVQEVRENFLANELLVKKTKG
jgi:hypothetical protein